MIGLLTRADRLGLTRRPQLHRLRGVRSALSACWYDWLLRGCKWTLSPFNSGVITTDTLKIGAAGDGDNRDQTFSAFQAVRRSIHWILPILPQTRKPERRSTGTLHQQTPQCSQATIYFAERDQS